MLIHDRVVVGVDQATKSGWSIHVGARPVASGVANVWSWEERRTVLRQAFELANRDRRGGALATVLDPTWFVFAFEDHSKAPLASYKSTRQVISLGGSWALWFDSLNRMAHPESMRIGITSRSWRARVLGLKANAKRAPAKAQAVHWAEQHTGKTGLCEDEAEAICVSSWGALDGVPEIERQRFEKTYGDPRR